MFAAVAINFLRLMPENANQQIYEQQVPVAAVEFLQSELPPGKLLNSYNWGGYLIWALPEYPVFVDGRTDLYSDEVIDEWLGIVQAEEGWQELLEKYGIQVILIEPYWPLVKVLEFERWERRYQDDHAVIFVR
jgi:hypothetical protein